MPPWVEIYQSETSWSLIGACLTPDFAHCVIQLTEQVKVPTTHPAGREARHPQHRPKAGQREQVSLGPAADTQGRGRRCPCRDSRLSLWRPGGGIGWGGVRAGLTPGADFHPPGLRRCRGPRPLCAPNADFAEVGETQLPECPEGKWGEQGRGSKVKEPRDRRACPQPQAEEGSSVPPADQLWRPESGAGPLSVPSTPPNPQKELEWAGGSSQKGVHRKGDSADCGGRGMAPGGRDSQLPTVRPPTPPVFRGWLVLQGLLRSLSTVQVPRPHSQTV